MFITSFDSPVGKLTLASFGEKLNGLSIENQKHILPSSNVSLVEDDSLPIFIKTKNWLNDYFSGKNPSISSLEIQPLGNEFRLAVWKLLCEIPFGQTETYGEIAKKVARILDKKTMSAQAVGNAVGHNPISIVIPCHRVVGQNFNLVGYDGGIDKKIKLLTLEGVSLTNFKLPKQ